MTTTNTRFVAKNGLDNNSNSIANIGVTGASLTLSGANALTLTTTGATNVTFPTSGTLLTTTGTALSATNIAGGVIGNVAYQTAAGVTAFLTNGTSGFVLTSAGVGSIPTWAASAAFTSTDDTTTNATYYPAIVTTAGGSTVKTSSSKFSFNPSTGLLTTTGHTVTNDILVNGVKVGRGPGSIVSNTAVGNSALNSNASGSQNVAVGTSALGSVTTATNCTAIGFNALSDNTYSNNTAVGSNALYRHGIGLSNLAVGDNTLSSDGTGTQSTAVGSFALNSQTGLVTASTITPGNSYTDGTYTNIQLTVSGNTASPNPYATITVLSGAVTAVTITTNGIINVASPATATLANSGDLGPGSNFSVLLLISSVSGNTALGYLSGQILVSGSNNTYIGAAAHAFSSADSNSIVIGANAVSLGSNTTVIGNSSTTQTVVYGAVGIGGANYGTPGQVLTSAGSSAAASWSKAGIGGGQDSIFTETDQLMTTSFTIGADAQQSCTISIATPATITQANTFVAGQPVFFTTTGALPTGLSANTRYYVSATSLGSSGFQVSATSGGSSIVTTGSQSGSHKCGKCKNATTIGPFNIASGAALTIPTGSRFIVL